METAEHLICLARDGRSLADAAAEAGTDAPVPTCPDWRIRDLLRHAGTVHRWATGFVTNGQLNPRRPEAEPDLDGDTLVEWYREAHALLVAALAEAPAGLTCWTFLPAPTPLAFWARRQAHETAVHRVDAHSALGPVRDTAAPPLGTGLAADGIDELLTGFHGRERSRVRSDAPRVLRVRTTDTDDVWTVRISAGPPRTDRTAEGPADCEMAGPAERLYLALWNRLPPGALTLTGDPETARLWRERSAV
ncbi:hypothetical protein CU044_2160 [Streptomyces sp. L-9-10]|uniref:maleylpyruvate isomerase family mycothiol-dependent enzyme n=1 Tax=Streptomyces sp. L-9-10 TaxID=1478131 RepID=UPI00101BC4A7|nr:maleylpyruvate isomerase family mycothiol-dependent enzyme [Streptomyces sp. L-9-10]RYJ29067.1 hypothetical protein CU044_2160 [Streptomyces sp. L-9-10]